MRNMDDEYDDTVEVVPPYGVAERAPVVPYQVRAVRNTVRKTDLEIMA